MALDTKKPKNYRKAWNGESGWPNWFRACVDADHDTNVSDVAAYGGPRVDYVTCRTCNRTEGLE